ncbi:MAG: hypothetical protein WED33_05440 [Bacteroidia bacterium]
MKSFLRLVPILFSLMLVLAACSGNQENKLIGVWTVTRMDALPEEFPYEQWEFTSDSDLLKYEVSEVGSELLTTGRWGFTRRNRLNLSKFDVGFNGEWEVVTLNDNVLRIVLKVFVSDEGGERPAGQVLVEFTRSR